MKYLIAFTLMMAMGCGALGSHQAETARAEDVGTVVGSVIEKTLPGLVRESVKPIIQPITDLARREAERRMANTPEDEPLDLLTQILIGVGSLGGAFSIAKTASRRQAKTPAA